jgi:hypothetical protein
MVPDGKGDMKDRNIDYKVDIITETFIDEDDNPRWEPGVHHIEGAIEFDVRAHGITVWVEMREGSEVHRYPMYINLHLGEDEMAVEFQNVWIKP